MRRHPLLLGALAVVVVTGVVVVAGAFSVPSQAASVNGVALSQSTLDAQLATIADDAAFSCYLEASVVVRSGDLANLPSIGGAAAGTFSTSFVDFWLSQQVDDLLIEGLAARQHLAIDQRALRAGRADLTRSIDAVLGDAAASSGQGVLCAPSGAAVVATLPSSVLSTLVRAQAAADLVLSHAAGYGLGRGQLARYFVRHEAQFRTICLSAIQVPTEAAAVAVRTAIESGEPFAAAARADSTDPTSAAAGGALGCYGADDGAYPTVAADVKGLAVGQVSQPVANNGSYLLLLVTGVQPASFDAVVPAVRQAVLSAGSARASTELRLFTEHASVSIDPRYGHWSSKSGIGIAPPATPRSADLLDPGM